VEHHSPPRSHGICNMLVYKETTCRMQTYFLVHPVAMTEPSAKRSARPIEYLNGRRAKIVLRSLAISVLSHWSIEKLLQAGKQTERPWHQNALSVAYKLDFPSSPSYSHLLFRGAITIQSTWLNRTQFLPTKRSTEKLWRFSMIQSDALRWRSSS
jgi:hypothetical protein